MKLTEETSSPSGFPSQAWWDEKQNKLIFKNNNMVDKKGVPLSPKQQAKALVKEYKSFLAMTKPLAIECAKIAIETHFYSENDSPFPNMQSWKENNRYWLDVQKEIEIIEKIKK